MDDVRAFVDAFEAFGRHLAAVSPGALALAILCHFVRLAARVRGWQNILRAAYPASRVPFRGVFGAYWAGVGVNAITPARGGDLVKLYLARHRIPESSYPTLGSTLVVETLFDFFLATLLLVVALQQGLLPGIPDLPALPAFDWSFAVEHPRIAAFVFSVLVAAAILGVAWASTHVVAFREKVKLGFVILGDRRTFVEKVVSWQALSWAFRIASVYFFLEAFNIPATFETVLAVLVFALGGWASKSAVLSFSVGMQLATVVVNCAIGFAAIAVMLGTVRWRDHLRRDGGVPTGEPAAARSRPAPPA